MAAARRAWERLRNGIGRATPWRFAICAIVPFLLLLTFAATARDIYSAPFLLGFGLLIALWLSSSWWANGDRGCRAWIGSPFAARMYW